MLAIQKYDNRIGWITVERTASETDCAVKAAKVDAVRVRVVTDYLMPAYGRKENRI